MNDTIKEYRKIIYLTFPPETSGRPMVANLVRLYDLTFNILKAHITPRKEGFMTLEIFGSEVNFKEAMLYLKDHGIKTANAAQRISRDEDNCVHCGTCIAICPSDAISLDQETRRVIFDKERCSACGLCTRVCTVKAMCVEVENGS